LLEKRIFWNSGEWWKTLPFPDFRKVSSYWTRNSIWSISRTKSNQIISNCLSFDWHLFLSEDIKFEDLQSSKFFGGCWRIPLGRKIWVQTLKDHPSRNTDRAVMWVGFDRVASSSFIWHMIWKNEDFTKIESSFWVVGLAMDHP